jgi:hypothetical protein
MQDATTRISGVAREASELSAWTEGRRPEGRETGTIRAVLEQAVNEAGATDATVSIPEELAAIDVPSEPPGALGRALAAILTASRRESPGVAFELAAAPASAAGEIVVRIRPVTGVGDEAAPAPFDFGRGGMGLALVLASHVLDDHGARLTIAGSDRSRVTVHLRVTAHLQRHGGSQ